LSLVLSLLLALGGHDQAVTGNVRVHVHGHGVAVVDGTGEDAASQAVANLALNQAAQRAAAGGPPVFNRSRELCVMRSFNEIPVKVGPSVRETGLR